MTSADAKRYRENLQDEIDGAAVYRAMAAAERDPHLATAAGGSFLLFAAGAVVPVLPFAFVRGQAATIASLAASALGLLVVGFAITLFTGRGVLFTGVRQLLFGLGAAGITFAIGRAIGVAVAP